MVIAAVDPNREDLKLLVKFLRLAFPVCQVVMFTDPAAALCYARDNPIDALYTEVVMPGMTGFGLQAAVEAVQPAVLTVIVTRTDAYAGEAIRSRVQDYLIKPVSKRSVFNSMTETKFLDRISKAF